MKPSDRRLTQLVTGVSHGAVVIEGPRYRFDHVWFAYEWLMDALARAYGPAQFLITGDKTFGWHTPAREKLKEAWTKCAGHLQVCTWCNINLFQGFRSRALLLGNDFCVYTPRTNTYRTARGRPLEEIDAEPKIVFFAEGTLKARNADFLKVSTLPMATADRIEKVVMSAELRTLGLRFERGNISCGGGRLLQDCRVALPFKSYGEAERDFIRVRCYYPDDTFIKPDVPGTN